MYKRQDEVVARALGKLSQEPPETRIARYAGWIRALNIEGGVITLSAHEKTALGDALLRVLPGGEFSISEKEGDFTGGLMVAHGRIEDNLTYDLVVRDHRPELARLTFDKLEQLNVPE